MTGNFWPITETKSASLWKIDGATHLVYAWGVSSPLKLECHQMTLVVDEMLNPSEKMLYLVFAAIDTSSSDGEGMIDENKADDIKPSEEQEVKAAGALGSLISSYMESDGNSDAETNNTEQIQGENLIKGDNS